MLTARGNQNGGALATAWSTSAQLFKFLYEAPTTVPSAQHDRIGKWHEQRKAEAAEQVKQENRWVALTQDGDLVDGAFLEALLGSGRPSAAVGGRLQHRFAVHARRLVHHLTGQAEGGVTVR